VGDVTDPSPAAIYRLLEAITDNSPLAEPEHERDCPACDLAAYVAGTVACYWDDEDIWDTLTAVNGLPGDTYLTQLTRMVAFVLHRRLPGHGRTGDVRYDPTRDG
jgi:hypothetical protein